MAKQKKEGGLGAAYHLGTGVVGQCGCPRPEHFGQTLYGRVWRAFRKDQPMNSCQRTRGLVESLSGLGTYLVKGTRHILEGPFVHGRRNPNGLCYISKA